MKENQQGFKMEKGTDYPDTPQAPKAPRPPRYPDPQVANPRIEEYPPTSDAPSAPSVPPASGVMGSKIVLVIIGGIAILGIGVGIFIYTRIQNLPFRFDDDKIIVEDSHGDKLEIDRRPTLPDDFPSDIPIFPTGMKLISSARLVDGDGETSSGSVFTWETKSVVDVVGNYYKSALVANGWKTDQVTDTPETSLITASKGERGLTFLINQKDEKVQIILTLVKL